jgi:hypothetical protein
VIGFAPRARDLTLYLMDGFDNRADALARLGRHTHSKSCLHVKSLADLDLGVLETMLADSVRVVRARYPTASATASTATSSATTRRAATKPAAKTAVALKAAKKTSKPAATKPAKKITKQSSKKAATPTSATRRAAKQAAPTVTSRARRA